MTADYITAVLSRWNLGDMSKSLDTLYYIVQCPLHYKATLSAKIVWPYAAGGLSVLEVKLNSRKYSPVSLIGGLIIEGGLWSQGPYNAGSTVYM